MLKKLRYILIPVLILLPLFAMAEPSAMGVIKANQDLFNVSNTDSTVNYLAQLFGSVGNTLHSSSGQLLGQVFRIFNLGVMVIAGLSFMVSIVTTVVHTAHEGRFMGAKQTKPAFTILRTVLGFGALVPMPSGYSLIQILTMSIILQGVGFANSAWHVAMDYFNDGGVLLMPPSVNTADNINLAGTVLQAQVCMYHQAKQSATSEPVGNGVAKFIPTFKPSFVRNSVRFPSKPGNHASDAGCGELTWNAHDKNSSHYMKEAMQQLIYDTDMSARHIVNPQTRSGESIKNHAVDSVVGGAADWVGYTLPARGTRSEDVKQYLQKAKARGWLFAGAYYYGLTSLQSKLDNESNYQFTVTKPILGLNAAGSGNPNFINFPEKLSDFRNLLTEKSKQGAAPTLGDHYLTAASYVAQAVIKAKKTDREMEGGEGSVVTPNTGDTPLGNLVGPVISQLNKARHALYGNQATSMDPVLTLQAAGNFLMDIMTIVWISMSLIIFGASAALSYFSAVNPFGYAFRDMLTFFLPLFMMLCVTLFVQGMIMAVYIPMIPFIIYTFAVMGWLAVCVESMVAAPLVALGLAHHEGHDMWGRSEEAIWLLLNVFLRPILMVIGLLAGMLVSRIGLKYLGLGFAQIASDVHKTSHAFAAVAELMMYIGLVTTIVHISYSLIHRIPDKVMRWLRSGGDQMGEFVNQATKGAQDGATQVAQQQGKMGDQALQGGKSTYWGFQQWRSGADQKSREADQRGLSATGASSAGQATTKGGGSSGGGSKIPPGLGPRR